MNDDTANEAYSQQSGPSQDWNPGHTWVEHTNILSTEALGWYRYRPIIICLGHCHLSISVSRTLVRSPHDLGLFSTLWPVRSISSVHAIKVENKIALGSTQNKTTARKDAIERKSHGIGWILLEATIPFSPQFGSLHDTSSILWILKGKEMCFNGYFQSMHKMQFSHWRPGKGTRGEPSLS